MLKNDLTKLDSVIHKFSYSFVLYKMKNKNDKLFIKYYKHFKAAYFSFCFLKQK